MDSNDFNGALVGALIAAGIAALGYVGKLAVAAWQGWRAEQRRRRARLLELDGLLAATKGVQDSILRLAVELKAHLLRTHPDADTAGGFEQLFSTLFDSFDDHARDLHTVIRGYTVAGLAPLNSQLLTWLRADVSERSPRRPTPADAKLALGLRRLDRHLVLWLAKHRVWMSDDHPDHCVVFLDDEQKHGHRFPPGLDAAVDAVLTERGIKGSGEDDVPEDGARQPKEQDDGTPAPPSLAP